MDALRKANPKLTFGFFGVEGFSERVFRLQPFQIESLLGPAASDADATTLDMAALRDLIQHLRSEAAPSTRLQRKPSARRVIAA